ncbi:MAG: hypothetical protein Q8K33_22190 [Cypionkella sp.]|uniref:hypothetical protein n=1 Tax=Cypionkella sp. TaxID=2811411 RepID=UPI00272F8E83|nr:hypothetical protein [Cypionkella sp.]MDP2051537.1 hypothetical protein [Cypionkella sp.]
MEKKSTLNSTLPGSDAILPKLTDIHDDALHLRGLIEALDQLADLFGPKSDPLFSITRSALPLARKIAADLERVM